MSELKRVAPQTLEFSSTFGNATKKEKGEKGKRLAPSFRFELVLDDKNDIGYSDFNYAHLLKAAEKKRSRELKNNDDNANVNGSDPFGDDDDDEKLKEIAKRFETKYGGQPVGNKKSRKYDDDVDLGAGYDENDSFIDNTDAYDEVVPEGVTTAYGGFYINSGPLEFSDDKTVVRNSFGHRHNNNNENDSSESSEDEVENSNSPVSKRREIRLPSSSDDDDTEDNEPPSKKSKLDENGEKKSSHDVSKKKKKTVSDQEEDKRENTTDNGRFTTDNHEEKKKTKCDLPKKVKKFDLKNFEKKPTANGLEEKKCVDLKKLVGKDSNIDDAIESVVNDRKVDDESSRDTVDSNKSHGAAATSSDCEEDGKADLPDQLPEDIKEIINKLKKQALNNKEGKVKCFDSSVNSILLLLEKKLRSLDSSATRTQVYIHIGQSLGVRKTTLINRAKKLCIQDAENQTKEPIQRLKMIIEGVMPTAVEKYNAECQKAAEDKAYPPPISDGDSSEGEEKVVDKSKMPQRQFPWTSEARKLVHEIASQWRQHYSVRKPRKESVENFVESFMETKVLPLWPSGWMRLDTLMKYANSEPSAKRKQKKQRENTLVPNNVSSTGVSLNNSETTNTNNTSGTTERAKTPTNYIDNFSASNANFGLTSKSTEVIIERKQNNTTSTSNKYKEKHKETSIQADNSTLQQQPMAKISVVPTAQLMAQKPPSKSSHSSDKFNPMDLTSSSLSITPVNDYPKSAKSHSSIGEVKKDVVSITPYSETSAAVSVINEPSHSSSAKSDAIAYSLANQNSKPVSLKQRILQDNSDLKIEKRIDDEDSYKAEHKDQKKRDRWSGDDKYKSHDDAKYKKRRKEHKSSTEQQSQSIMHSSIDVSSVVGTKQPVLSKEEQEQRQIEETMAATNFLSQIINDDSPRSTSDKRKESTSDDMAMVQPSEQEKDVQMVMRSLKELQELQLPKSSSQYGGYNDDYHRLYHKKDEKLRLSKEDQW